MTMPGYVARVTDFDSSANFTGGPASDRDISITRNAGESLVVGVCYTLATSDIPGVVWDPSGDNQAFAQIGSTFLTGDSNYTNARIGWYVLVSPTSAKTGNVRIRGVASGYSLFTTIYRLTLVDTSTPIRGSNYSSASGPDSASVNLTLTSSTDDLVLDFALLRQSATGIAASQSQSNSTVINSGSVINCGTSTKAGASSVTVGWVNFGGALGYTDYVTAISVRGVVDSTPPSTPTGLSVTGTTTTSITWSWSASTDDVAVTGYDVQIYDVADTLLTTVNLGNVLTYTLTGLTSGTVRKAKVRAHDAAPNNSSYSAAVTGTALDTSAPTTPSGLAVSASTTTSITWTWSAATDNVGVTGYRVRRRDASNAIIDTVDLGNVLTYTWTGISATNQRGLEVAAFDAAGNVSAFSSVVTGTASASGDTSPPTVPSGLAVIATTSTSLTWSWTASTDVGGGVVAGYRIQRLNSDDSVIDTVDIGTITQYQWTGLAGSTTKKIKVAAFDNAGTPNVSSYSSAVAGTTAVATAQLYARITLNRPATLSDPGYPPVATTMPGMVYKGWPGDSGFSLATGVKVTFTMGNANQIAAPMPLVWGDGTTVAAGDNGFGFATNWNGTVTIVNSTHGQIGSRFTVGA